MKNPSDKVKWGNAHHLRTTHTPDSFKRVLLDACQSINLKTLDKAAIFKLTVHKIGTIL
jgi:hypothetical protein